MKIHKIFSKIRTRILFISVSLIILISVIITVISYFVVSYNLRQNWIQASETQLGFLCSSIEANVSSVKSFISNCRLNNKICNFVKEAKTSDNRIKREAHDFAQEMYSANPMLASYLIRVVVVGKEREDIIQIVQSPYSTVAVSSDAIRSLSYFEMLREKNGETAAGIVNDPFFTTKSVPMIPFVTSIIYPYNADEIGYIFTEMSTSVITESVRRYSPENGSRLLFRINGCTYEYRDHVLAVCEDEFEFVTDLSDSALNPGTVIQEVRDGRGETFIIVTKPISENGWYVTEVLDDTQITRNILKTFSLIILITLAASSAIGLILFRFLSETVNKPVNQLQERIKRIQDGDFSRDRETEWEHELGEIGKTINDLSERIVLLMNQRIEYERQKNDYEYRMLLSQINPHFLYNTLNSIKWMATIQNSPGIAEMTTALSRLLKDISKGASNLVSIEHELTLLHDYFTIQQYRYGGILTLDVNIKEPELTACRILKFTLQPIVENSIFHGIEPKGTAGQITVDIYRDKDGDIHIDVTDDGVGIEPEIAEHLLDFESPTSSSFFREIGISNVHKRLQYEFGSKYGLSIASEKERYTTISILLPFQIEERTGGDL